MNLLIVDDEAVIISILKEYINWDTLGIQQVFFAYNAMEARDAVAEQKIDIIICDIEMPRESGLHFLSWVRENYPGIVKIILTGYPDFKYAQGAIDIGVFKFLLKPVSFEELSETVKFVVNRLKEEKKNQQQCRNQRDLVQDKRKSEKIFYRDLIEEEILPFQRHIDLAVRNRSMDRESLDPKALVYIYSKLQNTNKGPDSILYFALGNIAEELDKNIVEIHIKDDIFWIVKASKSAAQLYEMCELFLQKVRSRLQGELCAFFDSDVSLLMMSEKANVLRQAAKQYRNIGQLVYHVNELNGETGNPSVMDSNHEVVWMIKKYIREHVAEPINRQDMEQTVHLNGDYLNRIFKNATGYSLVQYIQYYKVLEAKRLLSEHKDYTIADVAISVGFDTPSYFTKIFKKWTKTTPYEYYLSVHNR